MRKLILSLPASLFLLLANAQFRYVSPVFNAADMGIKGNIKKLTEKYYEVDKEGKPSSDFFSGGYSTSSYYFNASNKISQYQKSRRSTDHVVYEVTRYKITNGTITSSVYTEDNIYSNGKNSPKTVINKHRDVLEYTASSTEITGRDSATKLIKCSYLYKNNKLVSFKEFGKKSKVDEGMQYDFNEFYEYNDLGQLIKTSTEYIYPQKKETSYETIEYNKEGYYKTIKSYDDNKLAVIAKYEYTYDDTKNWTACIITFDDKEDKEKYYDKIERTYEYYLNEENKGNAALPGKADIEIAVKNYNENSLYIAYNIGSKTYIQDTINKVNGIFKYTGKDGIKDAIYRVVLPPDNKWFQIIIDKNNRSFKAQTDASDLVKNMSFIGSEENRLMYENLNFIETKRKESEQQNSNINKIRQEVSAFQNKLIKENPATYLSFYLNSNKDVELPAFSDITNEADRKAAMYYYYKQNYFNNIDFSDSRLVRTDYFEDKIINYLDKLTVPTRDSVKISVDFLLKNAARDKEIYQFLASTLLNKYASSNIVCMDAVYVHIVEKYYCNSNAGKTADWVEAENLEKICKNAARLKPLLCGTKAPDIKLKLLPNSGSATAKISDIKAGYKVLIFWSLTGSQNDKMFTELDKMYPSFKNKNVEIISIATKSPEASAVEKYLFDYKAKWVNAIEIDNAAIIEYNIQKPTSIFVLDSANTILYKQLSYDQIESVINNLTN